MSELTASPAKFEAAIRKARAILDTVPTKIYGLQRSGTNYTHWLLEHNCEGINLLADESLGRKHSPYAARGLIGSDANMIVVVKEPFAWLHSLYMWKRARLHGESFDDFVHRTAEAYGWNGSYAHWLGFDLKDAVRVVVRHIDLLRNPWRVCARIANRVGGTCEHDGFQVAAMRINSSHQEMTKGDKFDPDYYLEQRYMEHYDARLKRYVEDRIDWKLAAQMGITLRRGGVDV